jgi:hypothetical protein
MKAEARALRKKDAELEEHAEDKLEYVANNIKHRAESIKNHL